MSRQAQGVGTQYVPVSGNVAGKDVLVIRTDGQGANPSQFCQRVTAGPETAHTVTTKAEVSMMTWVGRDFKIVSSKPGGVQYLPGVSNVVSSPKRFSVVANKPVTVKTLAVKPAAQVQGFKRLLELEYATNPRKFPRNSDKSKGLRHFSTKVCEKVREKVVTNYNEVADELVHEYFESMPSPPASQEKQLYDQKNIRRRVYDALNVLMAMNIISKEKKEIRWIGLPTSSVQECKKLEEDKAKRRQRIQQKREQLYDAIMQLITFKSLIERNRQVEKIRGRPSVNRIIFLPFITFQTSRTTMIECAISRNKTEYLLSFNRPFQIHYDIEILKRLGFAYGLEKGSVSKEAAVKLKSYLPPALRDYVDELPNMMTRDHSASQTSSSNACDTKHDATTNSTETEHSSVDLTDLEVAMTLSPKNQPKLPAHPLPLHSYYSLQGNVALDENSRVSACSSETSKRHGMSRSGSHTDFSDLDSVGSSSNHGF